MKIKSLELVGFKSFCEKTVVHFSEGVTAIVGPNGAGKSNVVDAIRWLMGETAPTFIRTKLLEDIIFSGSEAAPPMGMAEVTLIFDNSEGPSPVGYENFSEIQITRRAFKDGESEFFGPADHHGETRGDPHADRRSCGRGKIQDEKKGSHEEARIDAAESHAGIGYIA
jgi:predicted ATPase